MDVPVTIHLLADRPEFTEVVSEIRWREWGHPPEPTDFGYWLECTRRESGRDRLPVTLVAVDTAGDAVGAVGLGEFDIEERQDRSPWVLGMIVRPDVRGRGIGGALMARLADWASDHGYRQGWVATGGRAVAFYQRCGWFVSETVARRTGGEAVVLTRELPG